MWLLKLYMTLGISLPSYFHFLENLFYLELSIQYFSKKKEPPSQSITTFHRRVEQYINKERNNQLK